MIKEKNYSINSENLALHELIGLQAKVTKSFDKNKIGLQGKITNETKNTFTIETKKGEKILGKKEIWMEFDLQEEKKEIDCSKIIFRPEDRTKNFK